MDYRRHYAEVVAQREKEEDAKYIDDYNIRVDAVRSYLQLVIKWIAKSPPEDCQFVRVKWYRKKQPSWVLVSNTAYTTNVLADGKLLKVSGERSPIVRVLPELRHIRMRSDTNKKNTFPPFLLNHLAFVVLWDSPIRPPAEFQQESNEWQSQYTSHIVHL